MPAKYEAMRDKFESEGEGKEAAEGKAARIYNGTRKRGQAPVGRNSDRPRKEHLKKGNPFKGL